MPSEALNAIDRMKAGQQTSLAQLRVHATALRRAGDEEGANLLVLQSIALSRQNLALANARRKILLREPLAPQTEALKALTTEAETAVDRIQALNEALEQAKRLVSIFGRILNVLR